ncbi:hypothetical protein C5613_23305 [Rhodococcus opacus]|uniref:Transposase n=1 Tax=Rhodococcus opacus TaxID=37919 RepID=A0A2S8J6G7_RHOOP|nr:hypothetical protein C5613_23305 [Rhodococcus opacus]
MHGVDDIAIGNRLSRLVLRDVALPVSDHRLRPGRTFAEQIDGVMCTAHPQMLKGSLERIWLAVAGRSGTQRQTCRDTAPSYDLSVRFQTRHRAVKVLGVDDFALRRRHRSGIVLIDMATALPGDVLTDRKVDYLRRLADRVPGHDRGAVLAPALASKGRARGAPDAIEVAES